MLKSPKKQKKTPLFEQPNVNVDDIFDREGGKFDFYGGDLSPEVAKTRGS